MKLGVIGLGLIGGSLAKDARAAGWRVVGYDANPQHLQQAAAFVDEVTDSMKALWDADLIALCIPPFASAQLLPTLLDHAQGAVFDVASVKGLLTQAVANHPQRSRYVAAHPMAGREQGGPQVAITGLFKGSPCIYCDLGQSAPEHVQTVKGFLTDICGMTSAEMTSEEHDRHVAYVSHLPHVLAYALQTLVVTAQPPIAAELSGGSLADMTRVSKSPVALWADIFASNTSALAQTVTQMSARLAELQEALAANDRDKIAAWLQAAQQPPTV